MKNYFILFLLIASIGCKKENESKDPTCAISDFVGVWRITGGKACILDDTNVLTITDLNNGKIEGEYTGNGVSSNFDAWTVNNCTFTGKVYDARLLIDINITGTLNSGELKIQNKGTALGMAVDCTETLIR